jgi:hypothetical protein
MQKTHAGVCVTALAPDWAVRLGPPRNKIAATGLFLVILNKF